MMNIRWNWRLASRLSVITFAILVIIVVTIVQQHSLNGAAATQLTGTDLGKKPAPNFQLTDQTGQTISLSQFKGKPVVLTFLYTHCPDICPLTAEHLHSTMVQMGSDAQKVGVLAVSTDPQGDDQTAAQNFSQAHNMSDFWHFLIGSHEQLSPIWSSYSINAQAIQQRINHTSAIYVIDKQGRERVYLGDDFTPSTLATDLQTLLKED